MALLAATAAHAAHSRRIVSLVVVLYAGLLLTAAGALVTDADPATLTAAAATVLALGLTATLAGPLHVRLGRGREEGLLRSLQRVDRVRTLAAGAHPISVNDPAWQTKRDRAR